MSMERKTAGEIEAALSVAVSRVMKEMHGSGARTIRTHLVDDMVLVVLLDVFSVAQRRLACVGIDDDAQSMACLKQYRGLLWKKGRVSLEREIREITGLRTLSVFHDLCLDRGAETLAFQLDGTPVVRAARH